MILLLSVRWFSNMLARIRWPEWETDILPEISLTPTRTTRIILPNTWKHHFNVTMEMVRRQFQQILSLQVIQSMVCTNRFITIPSVRTSSVIMVCTLLTEILDVTADLQDSNQMARGMDMNAMRKGIIFRTGIRLHGETSLYVHFFLSFAHKRKKQARSTLKFELNCAGTYDWSVVVLVLSWELWKCEGQIWVRECWCGENTS